MDTSMMSEKALKPMLIGESNPYGSDPYYALYPAPDGCSGHRLCCLVLGMHRHTYLETFDRINLCEGRWSLRTARQRAQELWPQRRKFILFGYKVCTAWEILPYEPFTVHDGGTTLILPHPSGLCRLWNEPGAFTRARAAVAAFLPDIAHLLGQANRMDYETFEHHRLGTFVQEDRRDE